MKPDLSGPNSQRSLIFGSLYVTSTHGVKPVTARGHRPRRHPGGLSRARERLLSLQSAGGWWKGELETNVTMDAEDLLLREFLGIRDRRDRARRRLDPLPAARGRLLGQLPRRPRRPVDDGRGLRRPAAGRRPTRERRTCAPPPLRPRARRRRGGAGVHPDLAGAVRRVDLGAGARAARRADPAAALVPAQPLRLRLLGAADDRRALRRGVRAALPPAAVRAGRAARPAALAPPRRPRSRPGAGRPRPGAAPYERRPLRPLRELALGRAERWIVDRQEADGSWGGIQPPWVYSLIALSLRGYALDHPVMRRGLEGLERFTVEDGTRRLEACQSPVWDTALALVALADAGLPGDHPPLVRAADWLLGEEIPSAGTGRCAGRASRRAAGRSSSRTTTTPTSTTPP